MNLSLGKKVIIAVSAVFLIVGGSFILFAHKTGYMMLERNARDKAHGTTEFTRDILEYIMLSGDNKALQDAMVRVVSTNQVRDILILKEDSTVALRVQTENISSTLPFGQFKTIPEYPTHKFLLQKENDSLYEYIITPIVKKQVCYSCHRDPSPTVGSIVVKVSVGDVGMISVEHRTMNIIMTLVTFIGLAGVVIGTLLFLVIRPVRQLRDQISTVGYETELFEKGEHVRFSELHVSTRRDEIGDLINAFNALVRRLNTANERLRELHQVRLEYADRLATSGEMAASIAHEIKNPTAGVLGALQVLRGELQADDQRKEIYDEMILQLERVNHTVNDLLSYARPTLPEFSDTKVVDIVRRTVSLLSRQGASTGVKFDSSFSSGEITISADKKQLQQVIWNVVLNAQHAITGEGRVNISVNESGNSVVIRVDDTGRGIPKEKIADVFKPFFTTKHKGTGLGMTISKRIVEQHSGTITVESDEGKGTSVTITLPKNQKS